MNNAEIKQTLRGPMVPVITNYHDDLSINHDAIRENVRYIIDRGVVRGSGVFLAVGAGGDFPMLSIDERKAVSKTIVDAADGQTPVIVGAQDTNVSVIIEMARWAEQIGAYGVQVSPGYYFHSSADDCLRIFEAVHKATSTTAIMIYNTYWENYNMSLDDIGRLAELPRVVALKWSTEKGSGEYMRGIARFADQLAVVDNEGLPLMNRILGGTGFITHLCTVWPELEVEIWRLLEAAEYAAAQEKITASHLPWSAFRRKMEIRTGAESPVVNAALELCGRPGGPSRPPTRALSDDERRELHALLTHIGVPGL